MFDLSIIIVSYNTKEVITSCIESILKEGSNIRFEIIVVDNHSSDGTFNVLKEIWRENPSIKLIENKKNLGFSKAVNIGLDISQGLNVLLLNPDTIVKKFSLGRLFKFALSTPDAGVIGAKLLEENGSIQPSCYNFPTITNAIKEYWLGIKGAYEKFSPQGNGAFEVEAVVGAVFLITQKARQKIGHLNENYFMYYEDLEYCQKVKKAGLKVYYYSLASFVHFHGESGKERPVLQKQRLIDSSKLYHGQLKHCLINTIIWLGQKWQRIIKK